MSCCRRRLRRRLQLDSASSDTLLRRWNLEARLLEPFFALFVVWFGGGIMLLFALATEDEVLEVL